MKAGDVIAFEDLEAKKPSNYGINAKEYLKVMGKKLNKDMNKWDFINSSDLE